MDEKPDAIFYPDMSYNIDEESGVERERDRNGEMEMGKYEVVFSSV